MQVKTCTRCGETKPLEQFPPIRRSEPEKRQTWCRACFKEVNDRNYRPYYERERDRILGRIAAHRAVIRAHIIEYLQQHPCVDCGETDIVVLEFDHQGNKIADISTYAMGGRSWEIVKAEIDKCEVRCANCHRLRTAEGWRQSRAATAEAPMRPVTPRQPVVQLLIAAAMETRACRVCKNVKPLTEFPFRSLPEQTRQWICLACQRDYTRDWYSRNRQAHMANARERSVEQRARVIAQLSDYLMQHPCVDCGESDPRILEFDHLRDKTADVSALVLNGHSWATIKAEIDKCVVRCANCHRRKTAIERGWYRTRRAG